MELESKDIESSSGIDLNVIEQMVETPKKEVVFELNPDSVHIEGVEQTQSIIMPEYPTVESIEPTPSPPQIKAHQFSRHEIQRAKAQPTNSEDDPRYDDLMQVTEGYQIGESEKSRCYLQET